MASSPRRLLPLLLAASLAPALLGCGDEQAPPAAAPPKAGPPAAPKPPAVKPPAEKAGNANTSDTLAEGRRPLAPVPAGRKEPAAEAAPEPALPGINRWYDNLRDGQKL